MNDDELNEAIRTIKYYMSSIEKSFIFEDDLKYNLGSYNGLELALAELEQREPVLKNINDVMREVSNEPTNR